MEIVIDIKNLIYTIRGIKVMLDSDLAKIYGYQTRSFNQQVKNNIEKFDEDFRFQLTKEEYEKILKSKNLTSSWGGIRKLPYVFTEQGIYMLMTVLKGELAIKQSKASSKDAGNKIMSISKVNDNHVYHQIIDTLLANPILTLK